MTNKELNMAIAEACGWTNLNPDFQSPFNSDDRWLIGQMPSGAIGIVPDYCGSLDAMHEAEDMLSDSLMEVMQGHLEECGCWPLWRADAHQRAEAFLRALGKWRD